MTGGAVAGRGRQIRRRRRRPRKADPPPLLPSRAEEGRCTAAVDLASCAIAWGLGRERRRLGARVRRRLGAKVRCRFCEREMPGEVVAAERRARVRAGAFMCPLFG